MKQTVQAKLFVTSHKLLQYFLAAICETHHKGQIKHTFKICSLVIIVIICVRDKTDIQ